MWFSRIALSEMNALQPVFALQVEVIAGDDARIPLVGHEGEQPFAEDGFGIWLAKVQNVQSFLKQGLQDGIFFYEELGRCGYCNLHYWVLIVSSVYWLLPSKQWVQIWHFGSPMLSMSVSSLLN